MIAATITGNMGADAEMRVLPDGTTVVNLRVASNSREKNGEEWVDVPTWVTISVFGRRAEGLTKLGLVKGTKIAARGTIKLREYSKRDGTSGVSLEMRADDIELMGSKNDNGSAPRAGRRADDDLPF